MAIVKTELRPETNPNDVIYPKTSADQVEGLTEKIENSIPTAESNKIGGISVPLTSTVTGQRSNFLDLLASGVLETTPLYLHTIALVRESANPTSHSNSRLSVVIKCLSTKSSFDVTSLSELSFFIESDSVILSVNGSLYYVDGSDSVFGTVHNLYNDYPNIFLIFNTIIIPSDYSNTPDFSINYEELLDSTNLTISDNVELITRAGN